MKEQRIKLETAKIAKEKGFDVDSKHFIAEGEYGYIFDITKKNPAIFIHHPTQALLQKWLREKHELYVESNPNTSGYGWFIDKTNGTAISDCRFTGPNSGGRWDIYEDALEIGLQEALKLIKY